jgi:hypothetical protein
MQLSEELSHIHPHDEPAAWMAPLPDPVVSDILVMTALVSVGCAFLQAVISFSRR